jgi:hypothetical protein
VVPGLPSSVELLLEQPATTPPIASAATIIKALPSIVRIGFFMDVSRSVSD